MKLRQAVVDTTNKQLQRVDTGAFETAQEGVEYYSQEQHGRVWGIIYRKYFNIPNAVGVGQTLDISIGATIDRLVGFAGYVVQLGGSLLPLAFSWVGFTSDNVGVMVLSNHQTLRITAGSTLDHEGGKCWIDYTK